MEIKRNGSRPSGKGRPNTSPARCASIRCFEAPAPARGFGASVTFEAGARTAWHTHPLGQTLIVISGLGWAQRWGGPRRKSGRAMSIWFPPGEKHWHGAAATTAMTHIAIVEELGRQVGRLAGEGQRRAIRRLISGCGANRWS